MGKLKNRLLVSLRQGPKLFISFPFFNLPAASHVEKRPVVWKDRDIRSSPPSYPQRYPHLSAIYFADNLVDMLLKSAILFDANSHLRAGVNNS